MNLNSSVGYQQAEKKWFVKVCDIKKKGGYLYNFLQSCETIFKVIFWLIFMLSYVSGGVAWCRSSVESCFPNVRFSWVVPSPFYSDSISYLLHCYLVSLYCIIAYKGIFLGRNVHYLCMIFFYHLWLSEEWNNVSFYLFINYNCWISPPPRNSGNTFISFCKEIEINVKTWGYISVCMA